MLHLDLFSGIGGFAYAADQVWPGIEHIFCDTDEFCRQVLKKHWPESETYDDIRNITEPIRADIVTGGFPCQPFSAAGLRRGTDDDRYLWPEMLRVIRLTEPEWVIAENVRGLLTLQQGVVFEQVCADLEASGYEVQPFIIPAVALNAPHRRDRVWFVANRTGDRREWGGTAASAQERHAPRPVQAWQLARRPERPYSDAADTQSSESQESWAKQGWASCGRTDCYSWQQDWLEVAAEFCSVDDGLPIELDGFELSKSQHRRQQLKAYGNAIVPEVAIEIMRGIAAAQAAELTQAA